MLYTLAEAAKASGLGASAIRTAIERGQIAAIRDLFDEWQVEDSELHRLYFPVGPGNAQRDERASPSSPSVVEVNVQTGAQLKGAAHLVHDGCGAAPPESIEPDRGGATQSASPARTDPASCSPESGENDGTDDEQTRLPLQRCLAPLALTGGADRHRNGEGRLQLSALDCNDRIAVANTLFWESEVKIGDRPEALDSAMRPLPDRGRTVVFTAALLTAFIVGWVGGLGSYHLFRRSLASPSDDHRSYSAASTAKQAASAERERGEPTSGALVTGKITPHAVGENRAKRRPASQSTAQNPELRTSKAASTTRQNSAEATLETAWEPSGAAVSHATNDSPPRVPVPETKPSTVEGWTVRSVYNGTVVLEGPGGVWTAARGDTVPGLGRVDSIVLWGSRWIVATTRGLVTTP